LLLCPPFAAAQDLPTTNHIDPKKVEINDTKTYHNKVKVVPSYLLKPVSVDLSNYKQVLVGSGYIKEEQLAK
jgi:putative multiple sugar transport system substrate-binding protein